MLYPEGNSEGDGANFFQGFKSFVAVLSSVFHTRTELFVTELEEERERMRQSVLLLCLAFLGVGLGLILATIFAVAIFWAKGWIAAIGVLALIYLGVGAWAILTLRQRILTRPRLFSATLAELAKDRDRLRDFSDE